MFLIDTYNDYCEAVVGKGSYDPDIRNEAKKALGILKQTDPALYKKYDDRFNGRVEIKPKKLRTPSRPSTLVERQQYLKEHPEIDVTLIREKLRTSLLKGHYGLGLLFSVPLWMQQNDVMVSLDHLDPAELIPGKGEPVSRDTILRRCIRKTIDEGRFDEKRLRQEVVSRFCYLYKKNIITLREPVLFEAVNRMLRTEATIIELMKIDRPDMSFSEGDLVDLINSKDLQVTNEDRMRWEKRELEKAKNAAKKQKLKKKKTHPME